MHTNLVQINQLRAEWHMDKPIWQQFLYYLRDLTAGNFGTSLKYKQPVADLISSRLGPTLLLTGTALLLALLLGLWLGTRAAWRHGSRFDQVSTGTSLVLWSVPTFWLGLIVLMVFSVALDLFPTFGYRWNTGKEEPRGVVLFQRSGGYRGRIKVKFQIVALKISSGS